MNPAIEKRINRRYAGATRHSPAGRQPTRQPDFDTGGTCLICGRTFKSDDCPHGVSDNTTALRVWYERRLLSVPEPTPARFSPQQSTPWLGPHLDESTRPVQGRRPTAEQVAATVLQELHDPGYLVSFFDGDDLTLEQAVELLARAVLKP